MSGGGGEGDKGREGVAAKCSSCRISFEGKNLDVLWEEDAPWLVCRSMEALPDPMTPGGPAGDGPCMV